MTGEPDPPPEQPPPAQPPPAPLWLWELDPQVRRIRRRDAVITGMIAGITVSLTVLITNLVAEGLDDLNRRDVDQSKTLGEHGSTLADHAGRLDRYNDRLNVHGARLDALEAGRAKLEGAGQPGNPETESGP